MKVLVINAGSSSLKYQLLDPETGHLLAKGLCERIGIDGKFTYKPQVEGQGRRVGGGRPHAHPFRGHPGGAVRPGGPGQRRHLLHEGDRRGGSPGGPRRRASPAPSSSPTR